MKKYNVILLLLDGARIDRIMKSPKFEKISKYGTLFSEMITHAPYTLVSMNSIFTGMYGKRNGINAYYQMYANPGEDCFTLAEYLSKNGWYTVGDAMRLSLVSHRGFDEITSQEDIEHPDFVEIHSKIIDNIINKTNSEKPFFLYLHYPKIHHHIKENVFDKYDDFSEEYFSRKKENLEKYDIYLDESLEYLEKIFSKISDENLLSNSIIVIMADHGMGVGEKIGERAYGIFTYDYSIKTFALFIQPEIFSKNSINSELTETIDILPTILDSLEIPEIESNKKIQGTSLRKLVLGTALEKNTERYAYSETGGVEGPWPSPEKPNVMCLRSKKWKLIHNLTPDSWELYNLEKDPEEVSNLIDEDLNLTKFLKEKMFEIQNSI